MKREILIWHPISMLPTISGMITGQLIQAKEQYNTLLEARSKPYVLNDETVTRINNLFTEQQEFIPIFAWKYIQSA